MKFWWLVVLLILGLGWMVPKTAQAQAAINAAVIPTARTGQIGTPLTVFAAMLNFGDAQANNCRIELNANFSGVLPITLAYQTTTATNQLTGTVNTPVNIPAGVVQNFLLELTGTDVIAGRDLGFDFVCDQISAPLFSGVNTVRLTISDTPLPDLIPIAVSLSADGIMRIENAGGASAYGAAVINIGAAGNVQVRADGGEYVWPMQMLVCETDPDGNCLQTAIAMLEVNFASGQSRTFSVFASASARLGVPFMPELARSFLRFERPDTGTLAASSLAITAPEPVANFTALDLDAALAFAQNDGTRALLIQRDGVTLFEQYWGTGGMDVAEQIFSGSKSFSCALAAAASDAGILNPDEYASNVIIPWLANGTAPGALQKSQIRARDMISLASGLRSRVSPAGFPNFSNIYGLAIQSPQDLEPGKQAIYGSTGFHGFTAFFELKSGGSLVGNTVVGGLDPADFVQDNVLTPIGSQVAVWNRDILGKPDFAAGASMSARNWLKYGQLLLDDGNWQGSQIISRSMVRKCRHYFTPAFGSYGLSFWLNRPVNNSWNPSEDDIPLTAEVHLAQSGQIFPASADDHFAALGFGNMQLHMIPSERLVIVKYGGTGNQNPFFAALFNGAFDE
ncbi:hypothetical protein MNBD_ALPHA06-130 [hydrothermal vent metagenome]|uniref:Beta-lactamase-related domain-containing protein n=1 Tax=hydrothermal vent metagenome TaxID=652676 RepID=A0A3B0S7Q1_9ZZZZ